jgi:signal transduction histidine kinase
MRKVALVFVLAVFVPSLVLAWLAVRSLRDQQFVLERQQSLLYQGVTDSLAKEITDYLAERQREFNAQVESFVVGKDPRAVAPEFDERIRQGWPFAEIGFCVTISGKMLAPQLLPPPLTNTLGCATFYRDNGAFLGNQESAEVYWTQFPNRGSYNYNLNAARNSADSATKNDILRNNSQLQAPETVIPSFQKQQLEGQNIASNDSPQIYNNSSWNPGNFKVVSRKVSPVQQAAQVAPNLPANTKDEQPVSISVAAEAEFAQLVGDSREGMIARFLQNKLKLMFWHRSERDPQLIFGAQLDLARLIAGLRDVIHTDPALDQDICVALLDENARPVALSRPGFTANWKRPFVATEVGEALPHWETGAYLMNPAKLSQSARTIKLTLGLLIAVLVAAIGAGSWLIVTDLNRQLTLARQKTDFVSNVSHELKTPLTSIRMFSELLAEGRVADESKQRSYLGIITAEAARLTRLINNVLDFSRMERGEKKYSFQECDLVKVARDTAESYRPHLENHGFKLECTLPENPLRVRGDCDALAQIIVNLISNAEKYSNDPKEIAIEAARRDGPLPCAEIKVLDRGFGVPPGSAEKIFEKFYRAHDCLSSGIQGSGLGLTLARQIARAHGGDVSYEPRDGGGSCFCLRLPLLPERDREDLPPSHLSS